MQTYVERNAGKPMRKYKITKQNAKHARAEGGNDERATVVIYGAPDPGSQFQIVSEVVMTDEDAAKFTSVLGLVPIIGSGVNVKVAEVKVEEPAVHIPADWAQLAPDSRKALASQITGEEVKSVKKADAIITEHLSGASNSDNG